MTTPTDRHMEEALRAMALAAVAPMEGLPLEFNIALEMAATNVAARMGPAFAAALAAESQRAWNEGLEAAAKKANLEAERIKHASHADGLGMGSLCCEEAASRVAAAIRGLKR